MSTQNIANEQNVTWDVEGIPVEGTLTLPVGGGPFPAVVFVAGSGPTDRNWNSPLIPGSNGSGGQMAQALTNKGFAVLRYDKRASGPKVQENFQKLMGKISMQGHIDELAGGVKLLAGRGDIDPRHIFALTNSEGAIHAINYQNGSPRYPLAGLVLTAPPGRPIGVVAHGQIAAQLAPVPNGDQILAAYDKAIDDFVTGRPVDIDPSLPDGIKQVIQAVTQPVNQPFSRELWMYDATQKLANVEVPVLVVIGKKDLQVDYQTDGSVLQKLAETHDNITVAITENANHVLKHEEMPRNELTAQHAMETYSAEGIPLDEETVNAITGWLGAQLSKRE